MVYRRKKKNTRYVRKKKTYNRRKKNTSLVMPNKIRTKLKYITGLQLTSTATAANYVYRGNSCFDPDFTGVGSQPGGFDELAAIYSKYRVISSSIKFLARSGTSDTTQPVMGYIIPRPNADTEATYTDTLVEPYVKRALLPNLNAGYMKTISNYATTRKILGRDAKTFDSAASVTANPSLQWFWTVSADAVLGGMDMDVQGVIELTYYVEFYERKNFDRS